MAGHGCIVHGDAPTGWLGTAGMIWPSNEPFLACILPRSTCAHSACFVMHAAFRPITNIYTLGKHNMQRRVLVWTHGSLPPSPPIPQCSHQLVQGMCHSIQAKACLLGSRGEAVAWQAGHHFVVLQAWLACVQQHGGGGCVLP